MGMIATPPRAVFRADASARIGGGHAVRCTALAQALRDVGWHCALATIPDTLDLALAMAAFNEVVVLPAAAGIPVAELAGRWPDGVDLLVSDGYHLSAADEAPCRGWARHILAIDDLADRPHDADLLLDQTPGRQPEDYASLLPADARCLLGPSYALLRPAFARLRQTALAQRPTVQDVLVSFGAVDSANLSAVALDALAQIGFAGRAHILLAAGAPHLDDVRRIAARSGLDVHFHVGIDAVAELMAGCDLALGASGSSSWERCCLGLPTITVAVADNQRLVHTVLDRADAAITLDSGRDTNAAQLAAALQTALADASRRERLARNAARLCDGRGANRAAAHIHALWLAGDAPPVTLRPATLADEAITLAWQQHPETRRHFRTPDAPTADEHGRWLRARLDDPRCLLNLIEWGGQPAGVLRFDHLEGNAATGETERWEVSILVAPGLHGNGIGRKALRAGRCLLPHAALVAEVHPDNMASRAVFAAAGYEDVGGRFVNLPRIPG